MANNYNYTPSAQVQRQLAMSQALLNKPLRKANPNAQTDVFSGLAHVVDKYFGGKGLAAAREKEAENEKAFGSDSSILANILATGGGGTPDFENMAVTQGMDSDIVSGAQSAAVERPTLENFNPLTPEGKKMRLSQILAEKNRKAAETQAMKELEYKRGTSWNKPVAPAKSSFQIVPTLDAEGNNRDVAINYNASNPGASTPFDMSQLSPTTVPTSTPTDGTEQQATDLGSAGYSDPKIVQAKAAQKKARTEMTGLLSGAADSIRELYVSGGAVANDQDFWSNLKNGVLGSETLTDIQERFSPSVASGIRKKLYNTRPLLIGKIIQASDMSAKALDSNRELDFYLSALASPAFNIQSQMAAIVALNEMLGTGETFPWAESVASTKNQLKKQFEAQMAEDQDNIRYTMKKHGLTEAQVKEALSKQLESKWQSAMQEPF